MDDAREFLLPIGRIEVNAGQPRRQFLEEGLVELMRSVEQSGILQPILVRPLGEDRYQVVAGERRYRVALRLGWTQIPAVVRDLPEERLMEYALIENLQREPLTPIEEAQAYRALMEGFGYTQEVLALRLGKNRSTIANQLRLLGLPLELQEDLEAGRLSSGQARALLALEDDQGRRKLRDRILQQNLSVREVERAVSAFRRRGPAPGGKPVVRPGVGHGEAIRLEQVRNELEGWLGRKVQFEPRGKGGRICLDYYSAGDLQNLLEMLHAPKF